ncbi:hypothetical protein Efla_000475 [Eimeria flavescens]
MAQAGSRSTPPRSLSPSSRSTGPKDAPEQRQSSSPSSPSRSKSAEDRQLSAPATEVATAAENVAAAVAAEAEDLKSKRRVSSAAAPAQRMHSTKSQVSFSAAAGMEKGMSMTSGQFLSYRQRSSFGTFLLPCNFFQSRAEIRTWGVEDLTDPSIQPYAEDSETLPRPFHTSLPGYAPSLCRFVVSKGEKTARDPFLGPEITIFPPTWVPQFTPNPHFKAQRYGYNWEDSDAFKMDRLPYVNAEFDPVSAEVTNMYSQCYPYAAYPYGVPRVA